MKTFELKGSLRKNVGKKDTRALRAEAKVPCVLYGGKENLHFAVAESDFRHLIYTPHVYIVDLDIDGKKVQAVVKDIQFHPVQEQILHVDFLEIFDDKKIDIAIPVETYGLAEGVKMGGKLQVAYRRLKVRGLKKDLPDTLKVDVSGIKLGSSIKVGQLSFDNLELLDAKNAVVASVKLTRAAKGDALVEATVETEDNSAATEE